MCETFSEFKSLVTEKTGTQITESGRFADMAVSFMFYAQNDGLRLIYTPNTQKWIASFNNATGRADTIDEACEIMVKQVNKLYEVGKWQ